MNQKGFTLIEIMIVIAMILLLTSLFVGTIVGAIKKGNTQKLTDVTSLVQSAVNDYQTQYGTCPTTESQLTDARFISEQIAADYTITITNCVASVS